jgi:hypothetical protein
MRSNISDYSFFFAFARTCDKAQMGEIIEIKVKLKMKTTSYFSRQINVFGCVEALKVSMNNALRKTSQQCLFWLNTKVKKWIKLALKSWNLTRKFAYRPRLLPRGCSEIWKRSTSSVEHSPGKRSKVEFL